MSTNESLRFPYMVFAREESWVTTYVLSQSGMPAPPPGVLGDALPIDAGFAGESLRGLQGRLAERYGVGDERVILTVGASSAMNLCARRWFTRGSVVASETPSYEPLRALPGLMGAEMRPVERDRSARWALDPARVRSALGTGPGPGHLFFTNCHNPTGQNTGAADIEALCGVAAERGGVAVCCEVYTDFLPPEERVHAALLAPNAVSIGSFTKAYGLGGLRLGWLVLGDGLADQRRLLEDLIFLNYVDPPTPCLQAGLRALDHLEDLVAIYRRFHAESRPHLEAWMRETEGVTGELAPHGLIAFPHLLGVEDTRAFGRYLARVHDVTVVPGDFFGAPGHLRLGFGQEPGLVEEGLRRLGEGLAAWRAGARLGSGDTPA